MKYKKCKFCGVEVMNPLKSDAHFYCVALDLTNRESEISKDVTF